MNYQDLWEKHPSRSATVNAIREWHNNDEFRPIVVQGFHGYGKSSFASYVASEIYGTWAWSTLKEFIVFHPAEFLKKIMKIKKKHPLIIWDDAGYWLNSMDYQNKFVKAVGKYMQVARLDWACIMFTSINAKDVISKIRGIEGRWKIKVTKKGSGQLTPHRRTAITYEYWQTPDGSQFGETGLHDELFKAWMPPAYYDGYLPYRKSFTQQAKRSIKEHISDIID